MSETQGGRGIYYGNEDGELTDTNMLGQSRGRKTCARTNQLRYVSVSFFFFGWVKSTDYCNECVTN